MLEMGYDQNKIPTNNLYNQIIDLLKGFVLAAETEENIASVKESTEEEIQSPIHTMIGTRISETHRATTAE